MAKIEGARVRQATVEFTQVLSGGGGVGKTQMAALHAHQALTSGTDLVVWVNAAETAQIMAGYAAAASRVQAPGAVGQSTEGDARAFLDWLAGTSRSWLVVLDDLAEVEEAGPWWPSASAVGQGRVLATTRRRDALLSGGGRTVTEVDVYTPDEALSYLSDRLTRAQANHLLDMQAGPLASELGRLPLALAHAAAYMINEYVSCRDYVALFTGRQACLDAVLPPGADTEGYGRKISTALLLTLDVAQRRDPVGLAIPAIRLAARLDPAGHPEVLWASAATTDYLTTHRAPPPPSLEQHPSAPVGADEARSALRLLHRYGLITYDPTNGPRAVLLHALTARAVRESTPTLQTRATVRAAADALAQIWPEAEHAHRDLSAVLQANTDALSTHSADFLWQPGGHPVLYRSGNSLLHTGLFSRAITHWQGLAAGAERSLGAEHPDTLSTRASLAFCYEEAGRSREAIALGESVVADTERLLGAEHPITLTAQANLALAYEEAGRRLDAITLGERVAADRQRLLGDEHPQTLSARAILAFSYGQAGRSTEAVALGERVVADRARLLGDQHAGTVTARVNLTRAYQQAGRTREAIALGEQAVAQAEELLGSEHPHTLTARANLSRAYQQVGRVSEAITLGEQVVAGRARLLGNEHPHTLSIRNFLARAYQRVGRTEEAIALAEQVVAGAARVHGMEHAITVSMMTALRDWRESPKSHWWWRLLRS